MKDIAVLIHDFSQLLKNNSDNKKKTWWENYLRHEIAFYGVGIPDIRKYLLEWHSANNLKDQPTSAQYQVVNKFLKLELAEEKLSGILYLQLFLLESNNYDDILSCIENAFDSEYIFDWNTCDWLAVRILTPIVESDNKEIINRIIAWKDADYYWKARASAVAFAQAKNLPKYLNEIDSINTVLIRRPERFSKTAVGWTLREISKFDEKFVINFVEEYLLYFTKEVVNNSLKYLPKEVKNTYLSKLKLLQKNEE